MSLDPHEEPAAIQTHIGAIFISLELSRSKWLITSLVPGGGQRMSKHWVEAGDLAGLLARFWAIRDKFWLGRENPIRSSSFRKPGSTGSGSTGLW